MSRPDDDDLTLFSADLIAEMLDPTVTPLFAEGFAA